MLYKEKQLYVCRIVSWDITYFLRDSSLALLVVDATW